MPARSVASASAATPARVASSRSSARTTSTPASTAVEAAGGSVVEKPYDYPGGRRFIFGDPDGNVLGVYQPSDS